MAYWNLANKSWTDFKKIFASFKFACKSEIWHLPKTIYYDIFDPILNLAVVLNGLIRIIEKTEELFDVVWNSICVGKSVFTERKFLNISKMLQDFFIPGKNLFTSISAFNNPLDSKSLSKSSFDHFIFWRVWTISFISRPSPKGHSLLNFPS